MTLESLGHLKLDFLRDSLVKYAETTARNES